MPAKKQYKPPQNGHNTHIHLWPSWRRRPVFAVLLAVVLLVLVGYLGVKSAFYVVQAIEIDDPEPTERLISIDGTGTVEVVPDTADLTISIETNGDTAELAQAENTLIANELLTSIKALGIEDGDIQTSDYDIYEDERWNPITGDYVTQGWVVSQYINLTVKDTTNVSAVLDLAGNSESISVFGLDYSVGDVETFKQQARESAIADAKAQAERIASALDIKLGAVADYYEWTESDEYSPRMYADATFEGGLGSAVPEVEEGTEEVTLHVTVTYELY